MILDQGKTLKSWRNAAFSYSLHGQLVGQDYLGDTANGTGLSVPAGTLEQVHYNADTASGSGTDIRVHNVTKGTSADFTPSSAAGSASLGLEFDAGDELAISVPNVDGTTAGADVGLAFEYSQQFISST